MKPLILFTGATASGKTSLSISLHQYLKSKNIASEIINFDSLIFYKQLNIGTAKPTAQEMGKCPHHMINCAEITSPLNVSDYINKTYNIIDHLHNQKIIPILVGGSAFYIRALVKGMYDSKSPSSEAREKIKEIEKKGGLQALRDQLEQHDPESWKEIHHNDAYRTTRALEHYLTEGTQLSLKKKEIEERGPYDFSRPKNIEWDILNFYLLIEKDQHWDIINKRAEEMVNNGLIEEVQQILQAGYSPQLSPLQSIGYKETISYLNPDQSSICSRDQLIEAIYIATRRLAKSQKTFFKKINPKITIDPLNNDKSLLYQETHDFLDHHGICC